MGSWRAIVGHMTCPYHFFFSITETTKAKDGQLIPAIHAQDVIPFPQFGSRFGMNSFKIHDTLFFWLIFYEISKF